MASQVVKVRRDKIAACMTCPICNKLLKEATTISLCLHTFCRKCIYEKLSNEDVDSCPVCDINLGAVPVDKLSVTTMEPGGYDDFSKPDHNLQDIRSKIFPMKKKVEAPETMPSVSPPIKRKERSLSSLVVSAPRVQLETSVTGRRTRAAARKSAPPRGTSPSEEPPKRENDVNEGHGEGSSSDETLNKMVQHKKQFKEGSLANSSNDQTPGEDVKDSNGLWEGKDDVWKPLNCLVEAANMSKFSKSKSQGPSQLKSEASDVGVDDLCVAKMKIEDDDLKAEAEDDKANVPSLQKHSRRNKRPTNQNKEANHSGSSSSPPLVLNAVRPIMNGPVWFSLVAADNQEGGESLPQIDTGYLRVKDSSMPVSYIQKYLAKKLELTSENEVQLYFQGQPLLPTLQLQSLLQLWLQTTSTSSKVQVTVGSSAKEFVMVLHYSCHNGNN